MAGSFGLLGIGGALAATWAGKLSDRLNRNKLITIASVIMICSWVLFGFSGSSLVGLIAGVLLLDMGLQSLHITNQNIIFSKHPEARNRINTIYMVGYFMGGAAGTISGAYAWEMYGWKGVSGIGFSYSLLILFFHFIFKKPDAENIS